MAQSTGGGPRKSRAIGAATALGLGVQPQRDVPVLASMPERAVPAYLFVVLPGGGLAARYRGRAVWIPGVVEAGVARQGPRVFNLALALVLVCRARGVLLTQT